MTVVKWLVCLANSRKTSGRCVAGKEHTPGGLGAWIRPVSDRPTEEVSYYERQYEDGSDPLVLDIMEVPLKHPCPRSHQSENWLLEPSQYWRRVGRATWDDLDALADRPERL